MFELSSNPPVWEGHSFSGQNYPVNFPRSSCGTTVYARDAGGRLVLSLELEFDFSAGFGLGLIGKVVQSSSL